MHGVEGGAQGLSWRRLTPAALGVWMLTCTTPLLVDSTVACWLRAAPGSATMRVAMDTALVCACAWRCRGTSDMLAVAISTAWLMSLQASANGFSVRLCAPAWPGCAGPAVSPLADLPVLVVVSATAMRQPRDLLKMMRWLCLFMVLRVYSDTEADAEASCAAGCFEVVRLAQGLAHEDFVLNARPLATQTQHATRKALPHQLCCAGA